MNFPVFQILNELRAEKAQNCNGLSVIPLLHERCPDASYMTLDEALEAGFAQVTEVSEAGRVPELRFRNRAEQPILLLDGEELVGAKQNRVLNLTILAPAVSEIVIPVSCVERGRWTWRSRAFASANRTLYANARRRKMEQVSSSLREGGLRCSDQADIWHDIAAKSARMRAYSDTGAAGAMYEQRQQDLEEFVAALPPLSDQLGAVFFIGGRLVGIELFGSPRVLAKLYPKLVRSYGLDALEEDVAPGNDARGEPQWTAHSLLNELLAARVERHKAIGLGEDFRLESPSLVGAALIDGDALVHFSAFARDEQ